MAFLCCALLFVALASPSLQFGLISNSSAIAPTNILPLPSGSDTCDNPFSAAFLKLLSPDSLFSTAVANFISFVNYSTICRPPTALETALYRNTTTILLYYLRNGTLEFQRVTLDNIGDLTTGGHYNSSKQTVLFFHGWTKSATSVNYTTEVMLAYLSTGKYNVMACDMPFITHGEYSRAVAMMPEKAAEISASLGVLVRNELLTSITLMGHSMGCHMAGYIARGLTDCNDTIIVCTDPAGPLIDIVPWRCQKGLQANDAKCVVVLHTDMSRFGSCQDVGLVNLYANGGTYRQPGCTAFDTNPTTCQTMFLCSHTRALLFWCDAVRYPGSILACQCSSTSAFTSGLCNNCTPIDITQLTNCSKPGQYHFKTSPIRPFGLGMVGATP